MTNAERTALQSFINKRHLLTDAKDILWRDIQIEVKCCGEEPTCSLQTNIDLIRKHDKYRADWMFAQYKSIEGQIDAIDDLGQTLAEIDFWK